MTDINRESVLVWLRRLGLVTRLGVPRAMHRCEDLMTAVDGRIDAASARI